MLAGPGVVIGTFSTALMLYIFDFYGGTGRSAVSRGPRKGNDGNMEKLFKHTENCIFLFSMCSTLELAFEKPSMIHSNHMPKIPLHDGSSKTRRRKRMGLTVSQRQLQELSETCSGIFVRDHTKRINCTALLASYILHTFDADRQVERYIDS